MKETGPSGYQAKIQKQLLSAVGLVLNKIGTMQEGPGWPDLYIPSPIYHGWLELKCHERAVSEAQRRKMKLLLRHRVPVCVLRYRAGHEVFEDPDGLRLGERTDKTGRGLLLDLQGLFAPGSAGFSYLGRD